MRVWVVASVLAGLLALGPAGRAQEGGAPLQWAATWGTSQQLFQTAPQPAAAAPARRGGGAAPATGAPGPGRAAVAARPPVAAGRASGAPARRFGVPPPVGGFENQTLRMIARTTVGGSMVRIRLSNAYGGETVRVGAAHIARRSTGSAVVQGSDRALTFGGESMLTLYAGQTAVSDPVALDVAPLSDLAVSLYLPDDTPRPTAHRFGLRPAYIAGPGDLTGAPGLPETAEVTQQYFWLSSIDVASPGADAARVLVTFGDSITDGDQSTPDTNGMWPAVLAERLQADPRTRDVAVVNAGIAGNRLLGDNQSALARLDPHVLMVPGVRWMTLLIGINDISAGTRNPDAPTLTASQLIAGYRQLIDRAHMAGVQVIGCTITPYGGSPTFTDVGEAIRREVNDWIRTSGAFDAVVDFDAATRDAADPSRFSAAADAPDLLHPGDSGYRLMAEAFDLSLFAD